uniref:non-specific serine/threonine protein kinase n=1 Tax=Anas platyrhynchos TaxID=8839 RepID=A0A8B9THV0_ANAPL
MERVAGSGGAPQPGGLGRSPPPPPPAKKQAVKRHHHKHNLKHRYEFLETLGKGTYGKVKKARERSGRLVAIKSIRKDKIKDEQDLVHIRREIEIMSSLNHPHIIAVHEVFENSSKIVIVMEYASKGDLYDYISERQRLSEQEARHFFRQVVSAVYYCHKNGIVHRDLKLENILLDANGNIKIADFGLSNVYQQDKFLQTVLRQPSLRISRNHQRAALQGPGGTLCPTGGSGVGVVSPVLHPRSCCEPVAGWWGGGLVLLPPSRVTSPCGRWTAGPLAFSSTSWCTARCRSTATTTRLWSSRSRAGTTGSPPSCQVGSPLPPCVVFPPTLSQICARLVPDLPLPPRCLRADPVDADGEPRAPRHHRGHRHALVGQLGLPSAPRGAGDAAGERVPPGHGGGVAAALLPAPLREQLQGALLLQAAHPRRGPGAAALAQEVQEGERRLPRAAGGSPGPREPLQVHPQAAQGHPEEEELLRTEGARPSAGSSCGRGEERGWRRSCRGSDPHLVPGGTGWQRGQRRRPHGCAQEGNPKKAPKEGVGLLLIPGVLRVRGRSGRRELGP